MAALLQPNQIGIREDLADYIAVVDAKSTPFVSMAPKGKDLGNMRFDWQCDNYAAPQLLGVVDGTDLTSPVTVTQSGTTPFAVSAAVTGNLNSTNPVPNRARLFNYAQVFRRDLRVGFIAQTQNVAGVSDEVANGIAKKLVELKRDMEATFMCTNQAAVVDDGTNAYLTSSMGNWLTGTPAAATAGLPPTNFAPASGSCPVIASSSLAEANVQAVLTAIYGATGVFRDYDLICGTTLKRAFTSLTQPVSSGSNANVYSAIRTFNADISDSTYKSSVDIFDGDFGRLALHPTTFIGNKTANALVASAYKGYVLPMDMCEIRYAKMPEVQELPNNGGGPTRIVQAIAGLVVKNPLGFGMFNGAS